MYYEGGDMARAKEVEDIYLKYAEMFEIRRRDL
jgi:hypothetical protein